MAFNTHYSIASINLALNALLAPLNTGFLQIYTGTQPANPDTALSGNTLLVTLDMNATAFAGASGGIATANAIVTGTAVAGGTATFFRAFKSDDTTAVVDGSVGASGSFDLLIPSTTIATSQSIPCTSWTVTWTQ